LLQRLSIGARLAVRTRLEILDPFLRRLSQTRLNKIQSEGDGDDRDLRIGARLVDTLNTIVREAAAHCVRSGDPTPKLFEGPAQDRYEEIRRRGQSVWKRLERVAKKGDRTRDYSETKRSLLELQEINEDYLALAMPRIEELLVPAGKRDVRQ
jgi:hypothetical protein